MSKSDQLVKYLAYESHDKKWVSDKLIYLLAGDPVIPPFSAAAMKLAQISRDENCQMEDVGAIIQMDPGLASDVIRVASSVGFAARRISSIDQAMMLVGMQQIRRIAFAMGVMKNFEHLKSQVDWGAFWLHSIMGLASPSVWPRRIARRAARNISPGCCTIAASCCSNIIFRRSLIPSSSAPPNARAGT